MLGDVFSELFSDNQTPYKMFLSLLHFAKLITEILTRTFFYFLCDKNGRNFEINKEEWKAFLGMAFIMSAYL